MRHFLDFLVFFMIAAPLVAARQEARQLELPSGETIDFLFYEPENGEEKKLPLLLFLHGGGESGDELERVKTHGPPKEIEAGREFPAIVVSPLNPAKKGFWDEDRLSRFLDALENEVTFDKDRLYLAGMSRGANGAYRLAMENPERFAALLVLCGAAPAPYAGWLKKIPTWIIHGEQDPVIPVRQSLMMAEAMKKAGNKAKLTIHPEDGHDVWTRTFSNDDFMKWFLSHKREAM